MEKQHRCIIYDACYHCGERGRIDLLVQGCDGSYIAVYLCSYHNRGWLPVYL